MNPNNQPSTPITVAQKLPVPILMFEITDMAIPVRLQDSFAAQDMLCDDKDLTKGPHHSHRPTCWSPLNDF